MIEGTTNIFDDMYYEYANGRNQIYNSHEEEVAAREGELQELMEKFDQDAKADAGKIRPSLVPMQFVKDAAEVREYGCKKYKDPDNWKRVEKQRYVDAMLRHLLAWLEDPNSVDEESGIEHWKHFVCNVAFISDMNARK